MRKMLVCIAVLCCCCCCAKSQDTPPQYYRKYPTADSLLKCLNSYHTESVHFVSASDFSPKINVTDSVKRKLLSLLKHEWTDGELKKKVAIVVRENFEYELYDGILNKSLARSKEVYLNNWPKIFERYRTDTSYTFSKRYRIIYDSVYGHIYDSSLDVFKKEVENNIRQSEVPEEIVHGVAIAGIKEALPIIRNEMATTRHFYNPEAAERAMAILGDTASQHRIFEKHRAFIARENWEDRQPKWENNRLIREHMHINNDAWILSRIHTQESITLLADWMDTTKHYTEEFEMNSPEQRPARTFFYAASVIHIILYYIQNKSFKEGYAKELKGSEDGSSDYSNQVRLIEFIRQWLLANKGKYELAD